MGVSQKHILSRNNYLVASSVHWARRIAELHSAGGARMGVSQKHILSRNNYLVASSMPWERRIAELHSAGGPAWASPKSTFSAETTTL